MSSCGVPEPAEHPRYVREQRKVAATLLSMLVRNGETPEVALRAALDILGPVPSHLQSDPRDETLDLDF